MGAGPAYVVIASWYPRKGRGLITSIFNSSHNVGGGLVAPITGGAMAWLGSDVDFFGAHNWQIANFIIPVAIVLFIAAIFTIFGVGKTYNEGLPPLNQILNNNKDELVIAKKQKHITDNTFIYALTHRNTIKTRTSSKVVKVGFYLCCGFLFIFALSFNRKLLKSNKKVKYELFYVFCIENCNFQTFLYLSTLLPISIIKTPIIPYIWLYYFLC